VTTEHWQAECYLDAKGLACPMPLLKLKQQLNRMQPGERIRVETTDSGSIQDFTAFCKQAGHTLLDQVGVTPTTAGGPVYGFLIKKCDRPAAQG
jgi:TusA-related sulfurtransferase